MSLLLQPSGVLREADRSAKHRPGTRVEMGRPGRDPLVETLDILIFDDSMSLSGLNGNDPIGSRYTEARSAVKSIARASHSPLHQIAVIHFDYPSIEALPPTAINSRGGLGLVLEALATPPDGIGTSILAPSMMAANNIARRSDAEVLRCTTFSDFELMDQQPMQPREELAKFPGQVHAVVMNAVPPQWLEVSRNATITRVGSDDPPGLLAATLMHSLTANRPGASAPRMVTKRVKSR